MPQEQFKPTPVDWKSTRVTAGLVTTDIDGQLARRHGNDATYHIINRYSVLSTNYAADLKFTFDDISEILYIDVN